MRPMRVCISLIGRIVSVAFIFCCVKSACNADKVDFGMDFETFADSLEPDSVNSFYEDMAATQKKRRIPCGASKH